MSTTDAHMSSKRLKRATDVAYDLRSPIASSTVLLNCCVTVLNKADVFISVMFWVISLKVSSNIDELFATCFCSLLMLLALKYSNAAKAMIETRVRAAVMKFRKTNRNMNVIMNMDRSTRKIGRASW